MGMRNTLVSVVGSVLLAGSSLIFNPGEAVGQSERVQRGYSQQEVKYIELPGEKPVETFREVFEIPLKQIQAGREVDMKRKHFIVVEGEVNYEEGEATLSYSSGEIGDDGPKLKGYSKKEIASLLPSKLVPRLNDNESRIYFLSRGDPSKKIAYVPLVNDNGIAYSDVKVAQLRISLGDQKGLEFINIGDVPTIKITDTDRFASLLKNQDVVSYSSSSFFDSGNVLQRGYFYPQNESRRLVPLEEHLVKSLAMEKGREGLESLIEMADDAFQAKTGISAIPSEKLKDKLKPFQRLSDYFVKTLEDMDRKAQREVVERFNDNFRVNRVPLFVDSRDGIMPYHQIARAITVDKLKGGDFGDLPFGFYIGKIAVGEKTELYGELKDVTVLFKMRGSPDGRYFLGDWDLIDILGPGTEGQLPEGEKERLLKDASFRIGQRQINMIDRGHPREDTSVNIFSWVFPSRGYASFSAFEDDENPSDGKKFMRIGIFKRMDSNRAALSYLDKMSFSEMERVIKELTVEQSEKALGKRRFLLEKK